jgi:hypothetical protein
VQRLLRILVILRGPILAGTLAIAVIGSYADRAIARRPETSSYRAALQAVDSLQVPPLSMYAACTQPGYGRMIFCPLALTRSSGCDRRTPCSL